MKRTMLPLIVLLAVGLPACPDRKEAIDQVGGMPAQQVDIARERLDKANVNLNKHNATAEAAAAP